MFRLITFVLAGFLVFCFGSESDDLDPLSDDFIADINLKQNDWIADRTFHKNKTNKSLRILMGSLKGDWTLPPFSFTNPIDLPETFDARKNWPNCTTIGEIRDQGSCGSCFAIGPVQVMTDRTCIHSNGTDHFYYTAEHIISCSWACGNGCKGGYSELVWHYWQYIGIVSGGPYGSKMGCLPYTIAPCSHVEMNSTQIPCNESSIPTCVNECIDEYNKPYEEDMRRGKFVYKISNDTNQIRQEIYTNGPVATTFTVYEDFMHYRAGVYKHVSGKDLGLHTVKIIGWGVEKGNIEYWLVANSWNTNWGSDGFFKILRGSNECGIEGKILCGLPA